MQTTKVVELQTANRELQEAQRLHLAVKEGLDREIKDLLARLEAANKRCIEKDEDMIPIRSKLQDAIDQGRALARDLKEAKEQVQEEKLKVQDAEKVKADLRA